LLSCLCRLRWEFTEWRVLWEVRATMEVCTRKIVGSLRCV